MDKFSDACDIFSLTISQKKTQVMGQATPALPYITVSDKELEVVHQFQYLGPTTTDTTNPTKINVYKACVTSTLLHGSESWDTYSTQEQKLLVFHLRCLCRILGITWQGKVQNWCSPNSWCPIHVHTPMSMLSMLAGPHSQDGRWVHPQWSTLWWACHWG